jgi:DNA-binding MarR family transcriptional regulator
MRNEFKVPSQATDRIMASRTAMRSGRTEPLVVLERFLPYRLNVLAALTSNALAGIYAERFGLTIPGWRILATLGQYGVSTARDIAIHAVMHKSTVSRAVGALQERDFIARRPNSDDRREELLELTRNGRAVYEAVVPEALAFEARLLSVLAPAEREALSGLIDRLEAQARALAGGQEEW